MLVELTQFKYIENGFRIRNQKVESKLEYLNNFTLDSLTINGIENVFFHITSGRLNIRIIIAISMWVFNNIFG